MKKTIAILIATAANNICSGGIPANWTVETSRPNDVTFEAFRGETIDFAATMQSYGKPLAMSGEAKLYWQTNGMADAYWEAPATVASNVIRATWLPEMDVGERVYRCFLGIAGATYRAAFKLRMKDSPGATPNALPLPVPVIDFAKVRVLNPPWPTNAVTAANLGASRPLPKYLHEIDFCDSYPAEAQEYYDQRGLDLRPEPSFACSAVRDGGFLYRNFDFPLDERAEFVVKMSAGVQLPSTLHQAPSTLHQAPTHRFASVGVAQVGTNLTEDIVTSGKPSRCYKWLPGATVDGINENGVVCEINVVDGDPQWHTGGDIHPLAAVRWALDRGTSAEMVATNLAARIAFPAGWTQNFHYMIADERETWIVENGNCYRAGFYELVKPVLTNFRVVSLQKGPGTERYNLLLDRASITNVWYTNSYRRETNPPWVSDLAEVIAYTNEIFDAWATHPKEYFRTKHQAPSTEHYTWWQTVHTSIYDITNRVLRVAVQEQDDWYAFQVPASAGGAVGIADGNRTAYGNFASAIDNGASVGYRASAGDKGVAIGASSTNTSWGSVAIGFGAQSAKGSVAIGHSDDNDGVPVRDTARAGDYAVAIGTAAATGIRSVSIGQDSKTERDYAVAIGASGQKTNRTSMNYDTAVGALAKTEGSNSEGKIAIGYNATASESRIVQIGNNANSKYADPTKIGFGNKTLSQILEGAESDPIAKELANAAQSTADAADAKANSALVYASGVYQYMNGNTNAWFEGTNYPDRVTVASKVKFAFEPGMDLLSMPCSMALREIRDGERQAVWDQRDWTVWYWNFKSAQASNAFARITGAIADEVRTNCMKRGWAKYTAVRGLDNPDPSTLWIDTPKVQLMAGHQWEKLVELGGAGYWTLTGNGVQIAPQDAESTFLTIKDFEGNACLTFRKTSSYLVYCKCGTDIVQSFYDSQGRVVVHLTTDVQPTAEFSTILEDTSFVEQDEEGCPANFEWTGSAGNWDCHFLLKPGISSDACFARFKILRDGENVVEHTIPIKIDGGIVFDFNGQTIKCRPVPTGTSVGSTVNWVVAP